MISRKSIFAALVCAYIIFTGIEVQQASAATFIVTNLNDSGAGSLRQAILNANTDWEEDRIVFSGAASGTITLESSLPSITRPLSIIGPGAEVLTVSGADLYGIFYFDASPASISGLTISNGSAATGGGIENYGDLTVTNSVFLNNSASGGGGLASGGGGEVFISNCTFTDNVAVNYSGAVALGEGYMTISGCTFSGNQAQYGGAIHTGNAGTLTILNSTFADNTGTVTGGAISASDNKNTVYLMNNTFAGNHSDNGGALYINTGVVVHASNNIFANSTGSSNCNIAITGTNSHNLDFGGTGSPNICGAAIIGDPFLGALQANGGPTQTMNLSVISAARDAGDPRSCPETDQRGWPRPEGTAVDLGAVEYMDSILLSIDKGLSTGTGRVLSQPPGIDCGINCGLASALYPFGDTVTLSAMPDGLSIFAGWDAACGDTITMDEVKRCTATFTLCQGNPVQLVDIKSSSTYASIAEGYSHAGATATELRITASNRIEDLLLNNWPSVKISGGYNCNFQDQIGYTYVTGTVIVNSVLGSVVMDRIIIL